MKRRSASAFTRMLISYLVILSIPMLISSYMYKSANQLAEKYSFNAADFMLEKSAAVFEQYIESIDESIYSLLRDFDVIVSSYSDPPAKGASDLSYRSLVNLKQFRSVYKPLQSNIILMLKKPEAIVRREGLSFGIESFYDDYLSYAQYDYAQWRERVIDSKLSRSFLPEHTVVSKASLNDKFVNDYITYFSNTQTITILVLIDAAPVRQMLQETMLTDHGCALIVDRAGNVLVAAGEKNIISVLDPMDLSPQTEHYRIKKINDENMMVLDRSYARSGLRYISINPTKVAMKDASYLQLISLVSILVIAGLGIISACYLSFKQVTPLKEIVALLSSGKTDRKIGYEYNYIKNKINDLSETNHSLSMWMEKQKGISENLFAGQLLAGLIKDQSELSQLFEYFGIHLSGKCFCVILLSCDYADTIMEEKYIMLFLQTTLVQGGLSKYIHIKDNNTYVVILGLPTDDQARNREYVNDYLATVHQQIDNSLLFNIGVGGQYERLLDLQYSHDEASIALEESRIGRTAGEVVWYSELDPKEQLTYYYPLDVEQRLSKFVKMGNAEETLQTLNHIFKENFDDRNLSHSLQTQLFYELKSTVLKLLNDTTYSADIGDFIGMKFSATPAAECIDILKTTYAKLCNAVVKTQKSHNHKLLHQILCEIDANYHDPDLCVNSISDKLSISPSYFSHFFKEQTGENFSAYLEDKRIKMACYLLAETEKSVDDVGISVGYNSTYSFRRVFKKKTGETPIQYRAGVKKSTGAGSDKE